MPFRCRFFVAGTPRPKGSGRPVTNKRTGRVIVIQQGKYLGEWERTIRNEAARHMVQPCSREHPWKIETLFYMPRPKGCEGRELYWHTKRPDGDKLLRAVLDAVTGVFFADDSQVVDFSGRKIYTPQQEHPGVWVTVEELRQ